ncbi:MAG: FIST N-terminal domain-containing protein, partial [Chitinophagaceae bacterium]
MQTYQSCFVNGKWQSVAGQNSINNSAVNLVLVFGQGALVSNTAIYTDIAAKFPNAMILSGSTSGEIIGEEVLDDTLSLTAIIFEKTALQAIETQVQLHANSYDAGFFLMQELQSKGTDLKTVFVLSDGTFINGSELVSGMNAANINEILISGGLAGDAANFATTYTGLNKAATPGNVIAVGLYGNNIEVGHGSFGGWDEF